jgi:hypothetical protein
VRLSDAEGKWKDVRRITIKLKKPTRDGDREIHLLTNLPAREANARAVADTSAVRSATGPRYSAPLTPSMTI